MAGDPAGSRAQKPRAEPLQLPLPAPPTAMPRAVALEVPMRCAEAFDDPAWRFSVAWDGIRVTVAVAAGGRARVVDGRGRDLAPHLPLLAAAAADAVGDHVAVVEAVLTRLDDEGRPDLAGLHDVLVGGGPDERARLVLLVGDLLQLDSVSLLPRGVDRRRQALSAVLRPGAHVQLPDEVAGEGRAVVTAAAERGLSTVLARRGDAPYHAGVASRHRLLIDVEPRVDAVVTAVLRDVRGTPVAVLLAEWEAGRLVDTGRAALPALAPATSRWLRARVDELRTPHPPLVAVHDAGGERAVWLRPALVATVRHHGRTESGRLRMAAPVALRDDVAIEACVRRAPIAPPPPTSPVQPAPFRPAIITTLPFGEG